MCTALTRAERAIKAVLHVRMVNAVEQNTSNRKQPYSPNCTRTREQRERTLSQQLSVSKVVKVRVMV